MALNMKKVIDKSFEDLKACKITSKNEECLQTCYKILKERSSSCYWHTGMMNLEDSGTIFKLMASKHDQIPMLARLFVLLEYSDNLIVKDVEENFGGNFISNRDFQQFLRMKGAIEGVHEEAYRKLNISALGIFIEEEDNKEFYNTILDYCEKEIKEYLFAITVLYPCKPEYYQECARMISSEGLQDAYIAFSQIMNDLPLKETKLFAEIIGIIARNGLEHVIIPHFILSILRCSNYIYSKTACEQVIKEIVDLKITNFKDLCEKTTQKVPTDKDDHEYPIVGMSTVGKVNTEIARDERQHVHGNVMAVASGIIQQSEATGEDTFDILERMKVMTLPLYRDLFPELLTLAYDTLYLDKALREYSVLTHEAFFSSARRILMSYQTPSLLRSLMYTPLDFSKELPEFEQLFTLGAPDVSPVHEMGSPNYIRGPRI